MKKRAFLLLRIVVSFFLFFILLKFVNLSQLIHTLKKANKEIILLAILLNLMIVPFISYRWQIILSSQKLFIRLPELIRLTFIGMFFNSFLPTSAGGDVVKGYYLVKGLLKNNVNHLPEVILERDKEQRVLRSRATQLMSEAVAAQKHPGPLGSPIFKALRRCFSAMCHRHKTFVAPCTDFKPGTPNSQDYSLASPKGSDRKIDLGTSVLFDRIIGTVSVIIMALIATILLYKRLPPQATLFIILLSIFTLFLVLFLRNQKLARTLSRFFRLHKYKTLDIQSKRVYEKFHRYIHSQRMLVKSIGISFIAQIFSILMNYLIIISLGGKISPFLLFVYVPLIWVFALFPSINGLGIREGAYVYFFGGIIGKEPAFALSIVILSFLLLNGIIGGIIHLAIGGKVKIREEI